MKQTLLTIVAALTFLQTGAQQKNIVHYNEIPPDGINMQEGWKYAPNDNPAYATTDYNDKGWDSINPLTPYSDLQGLKDVNVGWLRLHFIVGPQVTQSAPVFTIWQNCASEIYLDGKLIKRYGVVSNNPDQIIPVGMNQPAEPLQFSPGKEHVLAIRFSPWKEAFYLKDVGPFMGLRVNSLSGFQANKDSVAEGDQVYLLLVAIFFLMSVLHVCFYWYDRARRANLFLSLYAITSASAFSIVWVQGIAEDARIIGLVYYFTFFIVLLGSIWVIKAMGSLFGFAMRYLTAAIWFLYIVGIVCMLVYDLYVSFGIVSIIFQLISIWLAVKFLKSGKKSTGTVLAGFIVALILLPITWFPLGINISLKIIQWAVGLTYLAPAVGISLYLAREFALNSVLLREKLVQVEALSQKTLQQEHEKQELLAHQNEKLEHQVAERTAELQQSLAELRQTQNQLIQSEKMASLGELTAGIAHEIQNPLNFVNNFSDVSIELLEEMGEELDKGDTEEAKAIASDIKDNLTKIAYHGRRADSIVKGMLQHSRTSTGQKELADINALADEYLRLSYHGLRAKDKSFNADMVTHFADSLPKVTVIPQDMGRVLLNLFNNAFYATQQRSRQVADGSFKPVVEVSTQLKGNSVEIVVKDNGTGIPDAIKDKILQPFFTTKPTGEGTGLGLSLSYDIVAKAHGGTIDIESEAGEGAVFIITLPIN